MTLWGTYYYLHFPNEEIGTQKDLKSCPESHSGRNDGDAFHTDNLKNIQAFLLRQGERTISYAVKIFSLHFSFELKYRVSATLEVPWGRRLSWMEGNF